MEFENISTGIDIEEISRFEGSSPESGLIKRVFTPEEIEYSFSDNNFAAHLCARFCAKEATIKALSDFGIKIVSYSDISITSEPSGMPVLKIKGHEDIKAKVTLSHSKEYATAVVLLFKHEI